MGWYVVAPAGRKNSATPNRASEGQSRADPTLAGRVSMTGRPTSKKSANSRNNPTWKSAFRVSGRWNLGAERRTTGSRASDGRGAAGPCRLPSRVAGLDGLSFDEVPGNGPRRRPRCGCSGRVRWNCSGTAQLGGHHCIIPPNPGTVHHQTSGMSMSTAGRSDLPRGAAVFRKILPPRGVLVSPRPTPFT